MKHLAEFVRVLREVLRPADPVTSTLSFVGQRSKACDRMFSRMGSFRTEIDRAFDKLQTPQMF